MTQADGKMEGWLYTVRSNRFGLQHSHKRYFVFQGDCLKSYKSVPLSDNEEPERRATLDSCIRVMDNGRESIHRKVFFIFTLYNTSNPADQLKLGASSPEEAAKWIRSLQDGALKGPPSLGNCQNNGFIRLSVSKRSRRKTSVDWTVSSVVHSDTVTSDVIAPSPWKIFGCQNGLRLFKEAKDWDSGGRHWDDNPAIMAVGPVDGTSEAIFRALMSLGQSRSEWDFCFFRGSVIEHLDGHTDIVHQQLYSDWLPWGMKRRDLLLRRYWRREDDGTYVILYHSVYHKKCPRKNGYVRAWLKSGGYVVSPVNNGKQSLVKHMLAIDWKYWKLYLRPASARSITISMLERVAALREMFKARQGHTVDDYSISEIGLPEMKAIVVSEVKEPELIMDVKMDPVIEEEAAKPSPTRVSLMGLNDASDEFFDVPDTTAYDPFEPMWDTVSELAPEVQQPKVSSAAGLKKKLQNFAVQKKGYMDLQDVVNETPTYLYGATLQRDSTCSLPNSCFSADPSTFLIRGQNYLKDSQKVKAKSSLMQLVGSDWIRSKKREDNLAGRPNSLVQDYAARGGSQFFFVVNMQVPGTNMYSLAFYYMLDSPLEDHPVLQNFVNGDDAYRNSRFKLIPYIPKGSWIVKQSVGKKACLVGQALEVHYVRGANYLELDVDVGSSTVARGVTNLVLGYLNNLVIELAFLVQGNTQEELPEVLLGTCRFTNLDASKSVLVED